MRPTRCRAHGRPCRRASLAAALVLAGGAVTAAAAPGDLDPSFGDSGVATADLDGSDAVMAMSLRPDGRIVVAGTLATGEGEPDGFVAQLGADSGRLEPGFGLGLGWSRINLGPNEGLNDVALRPDGRVVVAGYANGDGLVARLRAVEGTLDPTFGGGGFATVPFGATDVLTAVALQPDGRLLVAGYKSENGTSDGIFARLLENPGTFDDTFAEGTGAFSEDFGSTDMQVDDIALQPDGRIVYAGNIETGGSRNILIGRLLNPDGFDDPAFGGGTGRTIIDAGGFDYAVSVAIQPDGKIVAAGARTMTPGGAANDFAVVRVLANGLPDPSFSGDGLATVRIGARASAASVVLQPDGKIRVAGTASGAGGTDDFAVARLLTDGSPDPGFGTAGRVTLDLGASEDGRAIALRPDGRIVVAGTTSPGVDQPADIAVVRLLGGDPPAPAGPGGSGAPGGPANAGGPGGAAGVTARCAGKEATIVGTAGPDRLRGTAGPDAIAALGGDDTVTGLGGDDVVCGGAGRDRLAGGAGADRLVGGPGADVLTGGLGRDRLEGGAGADRLVGGAGLDRLIGGAGRNVGIQ